MNRDNHKQYVHSIEPVKRFIVLTQNIIILQTKAPQQQQFIQFDFNSNETMLSQRNMLNKKQKNDFKRKRIINIIDELVSSLKNTKDKI